MVVVGEEGGLKPVSIHTTDQSRRKKRECMEEIQELNFSSWAFFTFLKSGEVTGGLRLRQYSVGPVWLSAASHSVLIHTVSIIQLTPVLDG